jgi:hypothetical protein
MTTYEEWKRKEALKRYRERFKLRAILKGLKRKRARSVRTISGGLPSLGKHSR